MLICKGRSYSEPINVHWDEFMEPIKTPLEKYANFGLSLKIQMRQFLLKRKDIGIKKNKIEH